MSVRTYLFVQTDTESTMIRYYNLNGQLVPAGEASLLVGDLSILRGYSIFDFFLFRNGHPMFIEDYLDRFYRSAGLLHLEIPAGRETLKNWIYQLIEQNGQPEGGMRLQLTGGYSPDGYNPAAPNLLILQYPTPPKTWERGQAGIKLMTHNFLRELPEVKTTNYATGIWLIPEMKRRGADDLLYVENGEWVRESVRSNFFVVLDGDVVATAGEKVLKGITRKQVLSLARQQFQVEERNIHMSELQHAKEAFFTSSTKGVLPVIDIDGKPVGDGSVGPVTMQLQDMFFRHAEAYLTRLQTQEV